MANLIGLKAKAISELDEYIAFSVALSLAGDDGEIPAKFSIDSEAATLPMVGITEYGKMVGLIIPAEDSATPITVNATDRSGAVITYSGTVEQIIATGVGSTLGGLG